MQTHNETTPEARPGQDVPEQAFPSSVPVPPARRLTRRGALGRLLGLGVAAAALPVAALAAPVAPAPAWLADTETWELPYLERIARAMPAAHINQGRLFSEQAEHVTGERFAEWLALMVERSADPDYFTIVVTSRIGALDDRPAPPRPVTEREAVWVAVRDDRIASIRFSKLDRNARRRARAWIARQPVGREHPIIRLRSGRRAWGLGGFDFLDVAEPLDGDDRPSAYARAGEVFERMYKAIWRDRTALPPIGAYAFVCSHQGAGAAWAMHVTPEGRLMESAADYERRRAEMDASADGRRAMTPA